MATDDLYSPPEERQFGGYDDAMFTDPPDQSSGLLCPVCILVLREPYLMSCCGKHLCKMCLARVEAINNPCPCCNNPEFQKMFDKGKKGVILGLKVYCSNRGSGCNWTGELGDTDRHIQAKCDYTMAECPYGCGQCVPRHSIFKHTMCECSKRPIEVQLKCMEEKLRAIELKYEERVTELERNNTVLQATVEEQERKQEDLMVMYEHIIATLEAGIKEKEEELNKTMVTKQELIRFIKQIVEELKEQNKQIVEVKDRISTLERDKLAKLTQVGDLEKILVAQEKRRIEQQKEVSEYKEQEKQRIGQFTKDLQQLREVQKNNEDRLTSLKGSSDLCINELRKMEKNLKKVESELSCEVTVPVSLGKVKYLKSLTDILDSSDDVDVSLGADDLNFPKPVMIKLQSVSLRQKLAKKQSEIAVISVVSETFWFPPEKEEVFRYLFGEEEKWKKLVKDDEKVVMIHIPNKKPFTIEICGETRNEVKSAVTELEKFRNNRRVEVNVEVDYNVLEEVQDFAASKSVELRVRHPKKVVLGVRPKSRKYILEGGRYDVELVCDFIDVTDEDSD